MTLKNFVQRYRNAAPLELDVVARKIIEHCLLFFITGNCPEIMLRDAHQTINLNEYYDDKIKDSICQDEFSLHNERFRIYHLHFPVGVVNHELHLAANMQEVCSVELKPERTLILTSAMVRRRFKEQVKKTFSLHQ